MNLAMVIKEHQQGLLEASYLLKGKVAIIRHTDLDFSTLENPCIEIPGRLIRLPNYLGNTLLRETGNFDNAKSSRIIQFNSDIVIDAMLFVKINSRTYQLDRDCGFLLIKSKTKLALKNIENE